MIMMMTKVVVGGGGGEGVIVVVHNIRIDEIKHCTNTEFTVAKLPSKSAVRIA